MANPTNPTQNQTQAQAQAAPPLPPTQSQVQTGLGDIGMNINPADTQFMFSPMPTEQPYQSIQNPDGTLQSPYGVSGDQSGMNFLTNEVNAAPGSSPWAKMALSNQSVQEGQAMNQAQGAAGANNAAAMGSLETHGGMTSGAGEEAALQGARNTNAAQQGVISTGLNQRTGIQEQDVANQMGAAGSLASMNNNDAQFNASQAAKSVGGLNTYNTNAYENQMRTWGAQQDAFAQAHSGKK